MSTIASWRGRSAVATELRKLMPPVSATLAVDPAIITLIDAVVTACTLLADEVDRRPWPAKLADLDLPTEDLLALDDEQLVDSIAKLMQLAQVSNTALTRASKQPDARRFLRRLLGSAAYDRLVRAAQLDAVPVVLCVRRGMHWCTTFAVALDDCAELLTDDAMIKRYQLQFPTVTGPVRSLLAMIIVLDQQLGKLSRIGVVMPADSQSLDELSVQQIAADARRIISVQSNELIHEISETLTRKIRGARNALEHSADPVSQAANSMIELIDRLLRGAGDQQVVLACIRINLPDEDNLIYSDHGRTHPTKLGEATFFAYGGMPIATRQVFHEIAALGLVTARKQLQQLQHADSGGAEEIAKVERLINAVEAYILIAIRFAVATQPKARVDDLRLRFAQAAA